MINGYLVEKYKCSDSDAQLAVDIALGNVEVSEELLYRISQVRDITSMIIDIRNLRVISDIGNAYNNIYNSLNGKCNTEGNNAMKFISEMLVDAEAQAKGNVFERFLEWAAQNESQPD